MLPAFYILSKNIMYLFIYVYPHKGKKVRKYMIFKMKSSTIHFCSKNLKPVFNIINRWILTSVGGPTTPIYVHGLWAATEFE